MDLDYVLCSLRGRRVLDHSLTMSELGVDADCRFTIQWN